MLRFLSAFIVSLLLVMAPAHADERGFFQGIKGKWAGSGEIVAGKFKGTRFTCSFDGDLPQAVMGMSIDGNCRVGVFNQKMNADVSKRGGRYRGEFLDGAKGEGLDITGGRYLASKRAFVMDLKRKQLRGVLRAQLRGADRMNISISVLVNKDYVPVIGLNLKRRG
ncbi:MAG: hypothetical protein AAF141_14855 [Pseudomonadota bacterium]